MPPLAAETSFAARMGEAAEARERARQPGREAGFAVRNLSVLAYANGFTLWHYKAGSTPLAELREPGFFGEAGDMLTSGDMLMVSGEGGAAVLVVARGVAEDVLVAPLAG